MKPSTVVIALLCATLLAALVAYQLVSVSSSRFHTKSEKTKISQAGSVAVIPVTGAKKQILSPMPANNGSGRVVSLQTNDSNSKMMTLAGMIVKLTPVFDTTDTVLSDPSGTILNTNHS